MTTHIDKGINYCKKRKAIVCNGKLAPGITSDLKKKFQPHWDIKKLVGLNPKAKKERRFRGSIKIGVGLDRQLIRSTRLVKKYAQMPNAVFYDNKIFLNFRAQLTNKKDKAELTKLHKLKHPYHKNIFKTLDEEKFRIVDTQLPVGVAERVTTLDLVCTDQKTRTKVAIRQVKTGQESYFKACSKPPYGRMEYPFSNRNDSIENLNQLQITVEQHLYKLTYPENIPRMLPPAVYRCCTEGVLVHKQEQWVKDKEGLLMNIMLSK